MKILLISLLFAPIVYVAVKHKRWYLYLAFGFIGILPDQFAIELSESLPLLSGSRILILLITAVWLCEKIKERKFTIPDISLLVFLGINVLISVVNVGYGLGGEIKRIALMIFERVLLVIVITDLIRTKEEFDRCVDMMILACTVLAVIGIVQTVFDYDIAAALQTVVRKNTQISDRMGMTRAFGTTNAIIYGCYCAFMSLIILYRLEQAKKQRYAAAFVINFVALLCTMSRSAWLCMGVMVLAVLLVRRWKLIRFFIPYVPAAVVACVAVVIIKPDLIEAVAETVKSTLRVFGIGVSLSEDFGLNWEAPAYSRLFEWTIVQYMFMEGKFLFGYGYDSFFQGRLHYLYQKEAGWTVAKTIDVGLIGLAADGGILGLLSYVGLFGYMFVLGIRRRGDKESFNFYKLAAFVVPMYFLLNFVAAFVDEGAVWLFVALFYAYKKLDERGLLENSPSCA